MFRIINTAELFMLVFCTRRVTPETFYIEAGDDGTDDVLAIDRLSAEMTLTGRRVQPE